MSLRCLLSRIRPNFSRVVSIACLVWLASIVLDARARDESTLNIQQSHLLTEMLVYTGVTLFLTLVPGFCYLPRLLHGVSIASMN